MRAPKRQILPALMSLGLLILASGCIGSSQRRNPNIQRRDITESNVNTGPSLIGAVNKRVIRPSESQLILEGLPKNAWGDHDRDVYRVLDTESATRAAPVYPWFEAKPTAAEAAE